MLAARQAAKRGEKIEFRDTGAPGLAIRVKSSTPYFWFLTENKKVQIAPISAFLPEEIDTLRLLIPRLKAALKSGDDLSYLIAEVVGGGERDLDKAEAHAKANAAVHAGAWTWRDLRDNYLHSLLDDHRKKSYDNNRSALGAIEAGEIGRDFGPLLKLPVTSITASDLAAVLKRISRRGKTKANSQSDTNYGQTVLSYSGIKAAFKWATQPEQIEESGLTVNVALLLSKPRRPSYDKADVRAKVSLIPQLITIRKIEQFMFRDLWMGDASDQQRRAIQLQILTGQRIETVIKAHKSEFNRVKNRPWQYVWALGPDKMKAYRLLPLPEIASYVVYEAMKFTRPENPFLFPKLREQKKGAGMGGSMSFTAINGILKAARTVGDPIPTTFKGSHDFRRAFISHLSANWEALGLHSIDNIDLVTHKNEGRDTVAQSVYNLDGFMRDKHKVLSAYQRLLIGDRYDLRLWDFFEEEFLETQTDGVYPKN